MACEGVRNFRSLVEMPVLETPAVKRNRDERPIFHQGLGETRILECLGGKPTKVRDEVELAAVFQAVDHFQRAWITDGGGARELEGEFQFAAIRAIEGDVDCARKWLAAACAKWRCETW